MKIRNSSYKDYLASIVYLSWFIFWGGVNMGCQPPKVKNPASPTANPMRRLIEKSVNEFLKAWLISKDEAKSLKFFHYKAFENQSMLGEDCAGFISDDLRSNPESVRNGVREFLTEFNAQTSGTNLSTILTLEGSSFLTATGKGELINTPAKDKFWLFRYNPGLLKTLGGDVRDEDYLESNLDLKNAIVLYIQIRLNVEDELSKGAFYFLWTPEKSDWKIVHIGMVCQ